ncbi:MAG: TROVE domain-containing protein, partial [Chloroflexota bacterium]|nr:TROVE domain-containing protein [Chloroflexota bacterium]
KNDPALFALAMAAGLGDVETRRAALAALPRVARIGTHLLHFASFVEQFRGWGRALRRAVADWYNSQPIGELAYQVVKYQQRDGWSHADLLRLAHPVRPGKQDLYGWMVDGWPGVGDEPHDDPELRLVWAFERAKRAESATEMATLIRDYRLPREAVPTQWLTDARVWEALLQDMPVTAMIRNLATMTRVGLLAPLSDAAKAIVAELGNAERLRRARVHPIQVLAALKTYASGRNVRGSGEWQPVGAIVDALDAAFYVTFGNVEPAGRRLLLALDVSGSMAAGMVGGVPGLTPRAASAAMALITANVEAWYAFVGFTAEKTTRYPEAAISPLAISPRQRLDDVERSVSNLPFGGTDCALPMIWAKEQGVKVDAFIVYTDSESWAGEIHPVQALVEYRQRTGIPAKLVVVGMTSNGFSIADTNDAGMLDVVGFDTATPNMMSDFIREPIEKVA